MPDPFASQRGRQAPGHGRALPPRATAPHLPLGSAPKSTSVRCAKSAWSRCLDVRRQSAPPARRVKIHGSCVAGSPLRPALLLGRSQPAHLITSIFWRSRSAASNTETRSCTSGHHMRRPSTPPAGEWTGQLSR
eukprot:scaffold135143_cov75-Phaeocystis_antarctica.AAC.1